MYHEVAIIFWELCKFWFVFQPFLLNNILFRGYIKLLWFLNYPTFDYPEIKDGLFSYKAFHKYFSFCRLLCQLYLRGRLQLSWTMNIFCIDLFLVSCSYGLQRWTHFPVWMFLDQVLHENLAFSRLLVIVVCSLHGRDNCCSMETKGCL